MMRRYRSEGATFSMITQPRPQCHSSCSKIFNSINTTIKINLHNIRSNSNSYFRIFTLQSPLCYPHHSGPKGLIQQTLYFLSSNKSPLYHHAPLEIHSIKQPLFTFHGCSVTFTTFKPTLQLHVTPSPVRLFSQI